MFDTQSLAYLMKNGYPQNFINSIFNNFLQSKFTADIKYPVFGPQKKYKYISLPARPKQAVICALL